MERGLLCCLVPRLGSNWEDGGVVREENEDHVGIPHFQVSSQVRCMDGGMHLFGARVKPKRTQSVRRCTKASQTCEREAAHPTKSSTYTMALKPGCSIRLGIHLSISVVIASHGR